MDKEKIVEIVIFLLGCLFLAFLFYSVATQLWLDAKTEKLIIQKKTKGEELYNRDELKAQISLGMKEKIGCFVGGLIFLLLCTAVMYGTLSGPSLSSRGLIKATPPYDLSGDLGPGLFEYPFPGTTPALDRIVMKYKLWKY